MELLDDNKMSACAVIPSYCMSLLRPISAKLLNF